MLYSIYIPSRKNWLLDLQQSAPYSGTIRDFSTTTVAPHALVMTQPQAADVKAQLARQYNIRARVMAHKYSTGAGRIRTAFARLIDEIYAS